MMREMEISKNMQKKENLYTGCKRSCRREGQGGEYNLRLKAAVNSISVIDSRGSSRVAKVG